MTRTLVVLLSGLRAGMVEQSDRGDLSFRYERAWQDHELAYPLSLSMPLVADDHGDSVIRSYMEGLLPDNETVLQHWARRFGASPRNPFSLLTHVGEDVAGAVQFVRPERVDELGAEKPRVNWLSEKEVANRLRHVVADIGAWHDVTDTGYFSLAGAQPKTALLFDRGRWGVPSGRIPTTHILKPPALDYPGLPENEHLCLSLARAVGLPAAASQVRPFEDQPALIAERYDRIRVSGEVLRIHQEDFCQATVVSPRIKYEAEGGPGASTIVSVLRTNSSSPTEDMRTFIRSLAFHWAIGAPDAHAKNYSILIANGGQVRLAPLYDIISVLPYPDRFYPNKIRLAMRIGGEYRLRYIRHRHWVRFAEESGLDEDSISADVRELTAQIPDAVADTCAEARADGFRSRFLKVFQQSITEHARYCQKVIKRRGMDAG